MAQRKEFVVRQATLIGLPCAMVFPANSNPSSCTGRVRKCGKPPDYQSLDPGHCKQKSCTPNLPCLRLMPKDNQARMTTFESNYNISRDRDSYILKTTIGILLFNFFICNHLKQLKLVMKIMILTSLNNCASSLCE